MTGTGGRIVRQALLWLLVLTAATVTMLLVRARLDKAHVALVLLLVVLGAAAAGGRTLGLLLAGASFLVFNWFFLRPYYTFVIADPLDWMVLAAFLVTSIVAAQLLYRVQDEARRARERAEEVDRFATLGAETLSMGRSEDALYAVVRVIRESTASASCHLFLRSPPAGRLHLAAASPPAPEPVTPHGAESLVEWVLENAAPATGHRDGTTRLHLARPRPSEIPGLDDGSTRALLLPLAARGQTVGVLRVASPTGLLLDAPRRRFLEAIAHYAALAAERVRLAADAERAAALAEANRLKDALLASVSHDLRTPLTAIRALAQDLGGLGDERAEIIVQESDRLNAMVADLLDLSRLNAAALPLRVELNAVDDLLGALSQRVEPMMRERRLEIRLPPGDPVLLGRFDLVHSLRILGNLVDNAAKYSPPGATIEVVAARERDEIAIRVSDRGAGVPPGEAERIFEPFYRAPGASPDAGGSGLGLAIARRLAEAQNGRVTYEPRAGGGSVFTLRLPAVDVGDAPGAGGADPPRPS
jgi:two-component system sensor histidine kinase KdpD